MGQHDVLFGRWHLMHCTLRTTEALGEDRVCMSMIYLLGG